MRPPIHLLLPCLLMLTSAVHADEWTRQYKLSGHPTLRVETSDADIDVRSSASNQIDARVLTRGWKISPDQVQILEHQNGDQVTIEVRRPSHHFYFGIHDQSIRIELKVPRDSDLDMHTSDGTIAVADVNGELRLESGDGNLELSGIAGRLNANTHDGTVHARGRFDVLDVHTGDGNIELDAEAGSTMASSWALRTGDGRIELRLPPDLAADLNARSGDGSVTLDVPVVVEGTVRENYIRGKLNGGGQPLELRTGDGNIRVSKL